MNTLARLLRATIPPLTAVALLLTVTGPAGAQPSSTSTWAMYHHDVRHSGQSGLLGPLFQGSGYPGCPGSGCAPAAADVKTWQGFDKLLTSFALSPDGKTIYAGLGFDFCAIDITTNPVTPNIMTTKWC